MTSSRLRRARPWPLFLLSLLCLLLTGCGGKDDPHASAVAELNFFTFSEYIDPELITRFTQETGIAVNLGYYESSEEMLAKLQHAGGVSSYDVVITSNQLVPVLARLELIQPLDHEQLPNLKNLEESFRNAIADPGNRYSVAYQWGTVGLLYNRRKLPNLPDTWGVLFDPQQQAGSFLLLDELRDQMGVTLKYLGQSVNETSLNQLKQAGELLIKAKNSSRCLGFEGGVGAKNRVAAGTVDMAVVWNGDAQRAIDEAPVGELAYMLPREGSVIWADLMVVPAQAPHREAAHRFINFLLEAQAGADLSNYNKFATPNAASLPYITPEDRENRTLYPTAETRQRLEYLVDVGPANRAFDEIWTAVKAR